MTQNVGKMDPETDPDDRDDLWVGWFQGSDTDCEWSHVLIILGFFSQRVGSY